MQQITLEDVLAAKERLASLQAELRCSYQLPVVSFTANIPGSVKDSPVVRQLLQTAVNRFRTIAGSSSIDIVEERFMYWPTGPAAVLVADGSPDELKRSCIAIEEAGFHARLFDIDVFSADGRQISRSTLGQRERTCFLCGEPAVMCRRSNKHTLEEIKANVQARLAAFAATATDPWPQAVWDIGAWAVEAMLMEAACTPAPGLVDRDNAGAHNDMDFFTFLMSSSALAGSMFRCAAAGYRHDGLPAELLPVLRYIGKDGEARMMKATSGVNTQKGLLFLLGILAAAAAYTLKQSATVTGEQILDTAAAMAQGIVNRELAVLAARDPVRLTAGEKLYLKYGVTGIRGEVESGIPSIREHGLPVLKQALAAGLSLNDSLVHTLVSLMTVVEDTTILNRHSMEVLHDVKNRAKWIMRHGGMLAGTGRAKIAELDELFIARNISPGGVADLLAATYFLYLVETSNAEMAGTI
ncbi:MULTISPECIES: citrate lyase holo-[acyl-carrier protein] synthase [Sporomusa]|uniref:citrate lyase holo-[acyl-carrier protein] synthase n=1 Tax=Sporomusa TaxID=2375 RepID=UPI00203018ED|nr:citrate lyase holo-[acyl-carrier protein] synthase [Sporomusa sphaeroides]MCM0758364.1 citrate lyase holo-[acyl-carrier protein] synthase [Sporomusa sphaeroides DSM 2875]